MLDNISTRTMVHTCTGCYGQATRNLPEGSQTEVLMLPDFIEKVLTQWTLSMVYKAMGFDGQPDCVCQKTGIQANLMTTHKHAEEEWDRTISLGYNRYVYGGR